jgi:hypothetical protein
MLGSKRGLLRSGPLTPCSELSGRESLEERHHIILYTIIELLASQTPVHDQGHQFV